MAPKPEDFGELPVQWRWPHRPGIVTDSIDMEYLLQAVEQSVRTQVIAARLQTLAAVHRTLAEGAEKAAQIIAGAQGSTRQK